MEFLMIDGTAYRGRTYKEVVAAMADDKLSEPRTLEGYRRSTAKRVLDMYQAKVRTDTDRNFVLGLVAAGLMERDS